MIRVLVVDDQPVIRHGFSLFLRNSGDIDVVGEASSGDSAVRLVETVRPDVVLMDIRMPNGDGLTASRKILSRPNSPRIIVITTFDHDDYLFTALEIGVSGFLLKDADPTELSAAVATVHRGGVAIAPGLVGRIVTEFGRRPRVPGVSGTDTGISRRVEPESLTPREVDIVSLLARGLSNQEIASHLQIEISTVKSHLAHVSAKIGASSRVQVVIWAYESGLVRAGAGVAGPA
ncbi:response regulator [Prescottella equi]